MGGASASPISIEARLNCAQGSFARGPFARGPFELLTVRGNLSRFLLDVQSRE